MSDFTFGAVSHTSRPLLREAAAGVVTRVRQMLRARATRRTLADMDDYLLADIGIGRGDAVHEANRPMWDLSPHRF